MVMIQLIIDQDAASGNALTPLEDVADLLCRTDDFFFLELEAFGPFFACNGSPSKHFIFRRLRSGATDPLRAAVPKLFYPLCFPSLNGNRVFAFYGYYAAEMFFSSKTPVDLFLGY